MLFPRSVFQEKEIQAPGSRGLAVSPLGLTLGAVLLVGGAAMLFGPRWMESLSPEPTAPRYASAPPLEFAPPAAGEMPAVPASAPEVEPTPPASLTPPPAEPQRPVKEGVKESPRSPTVTKQSAVLVPPKPVTPPVVAPVPAVQEPVKEPVKEPQQKPVKEPVKEAPPVVTVPSAPPPASGAGSGGN
jgi:hypothetical protein